MSQGRKKKSASKRRRNLRKKAAATTRFANWKKVIGLILLLGLGLTLLHGWNLNRLIEQRFEGQTWAQPSRVYARPLEIFNGLKIEPQQLMDELKMADYRPVEQVANPGLFSYRANELQVFLREFHFADHYQTAALIRIRFDVDRIIGIDDLSHDKSLDFFQLTPVQIGSFLPGNGEDRLVIDAAQIPDQLVEMLLAVEDKRFYQHFGVSPSAILRALLANIQAGKTVQGGSTLTQQLAKNMFLTPQRTLWRKFNEALLSLMLEARLDKRAILTAYLNEVFLLQHNNNAVHGFALASKLLFKQPLQQLPEHKLALLVGMVKGPSIYNPLVHPERALQRRNQVLQIMLDDGQLDQQQFDDLSARPLGVVRRLPPVNPFPAYLDLVKKQLKHGYAAQDLSEKGLRIFTAFDPLIQRQLEQGLQLGLARFNNIDIQSAVVIADYLSGDLLAMTGDRDTDFPGFNRAILAQRPIGSLIKPLLLYGLLQNDNTLASLVQDEPIQIRQSNQQVWSPQNYDKELHGEMTLFQAFIKSYNLPFVRLGVADDNLRRLTENLQKINLLKEQVIYPSMLLGATLMTPYEVAQMYQVIANSGYFSPLTTIRQVLDKDNQVLSRIPLHSDELFQRGPMIQVQRSLVGTAEEGTAVYLKQRFPDHNLAGKTGTTNDLRDSWFAGFGNRLLTVVWLGEDENRPIQLSGSAGALRVWADIMDKTAFESVKLGIDPNLEWHYVHRFKGGKLNENCEHAVLLPFAQGSAPDYRSNCRKIYLENGVNWLRNLF
ncbi:MAG: penicillin-binding protein 1B [Gammaproteobacteria bacterium]|nr:penicillin-binding protein 1B [Gammaproteobacteria bacterium]